MSNSRAFAEYEFLLPLAIVAVIVGVAVGTISGYKKSYTKHYQIAQKVAERTMGDHIPPLSLEEKVTWYHLMQVKKGNEPTRSQLWRFAKSYSTNISSQGSSP